MKFTGCVEDGAAGDALLPVGDERIFVGRRSALLLHRVPSAVRIHGVQALRFGVEATATLRRKPDQLVGGADVQRILQPANCANLK